jgi:hypothetical protein
MISGRFAFQGLSEYLTWQKIKALDYTFPEGFDEDAKDLIQHLLVRFHNLSDIVLHPSYCLMCMVGGFCRSEIHLSVLVPAPME